MSQLDADGFGPADIAALFDVSRETLSRIGTVLDTLRAFSETRNLIGPAELTRLWRRHVADSLALIPYLARGSDVVDLGSGSGFPGLIVGCWQAGAGGGSVTLIESVGKKAAYLRAAGEKADLMFHVKQSRVEANHPGRARIVTARAFAPLPKLLQFTSDWWTDNRIGLFHKGARVEEELTEARETWDFDSELLANRASPDGVILKVSGVRPRHA